MEGSQGYQKQHSFCASPPRPPLSSRAGSVVILVDTDVLIDLLRGYPPALTWFHSISDRILVSGFSVLELLEGCRNRQETDRVLHLLSPHGIVWPRSKDYDRVLADYAVGRLDRRVGPIDVLIGEKTAVGAGLPLHTFNVRHFHAIPGLVT